MSIDQADLVTETGVMIAEYCRVCKHERHDRRCHHPAAWGPGVNLTEVKGRPIENVSERPYFCPVVREIRAGVELQ